MNCGKTFSCLVQSKTDVYYYTVRVARTGTHTGFKQTQVSSSIICFVLTMELKSDLLAGDTCKTPLAGLLWGTE